LARDLRPVRRGALPLTVTAFVPLLVALGLGTFLPVNNAAIMRAAPAAVRDRRWPGQHDLRPGHRAGRRPRHSRPAPGWRRAVAVLLSWVLVTVGAAAAAPVGEPTGPRHGGDSDEEAIGPGNTARCMRDAVPAT